MSTQLAPEPIDRVALKIWDSLTVAKLHLDLVRDSESAEDRSVRFDAIGRELETLAFHVRQILASVSRVDMPAPSDLTVHSDMPM